MSAVYAGKIQLDVAYPGTRQECDLCIGDLGGFEWAFEVKLLRLVGDNGKPNDNMLMHILSPYPTHRSALTDCEKLLGFHLARRKGIIIYGFDYEGFSMDPAIRAFEILARADYLLGPRHEAAYDNLVHPVHRQGRVFAWELLGGTA